MSAMDMFWAAPPIARTLAASALLMSITVYTGMLSGYWVIFNTSFLWKMPPQLWRFFSSFLLTGKDLSIIFDTYFMYTYCSKLEIASPRFTQPGDFFTYIVFVCATIIGLNTFITGGVIFTSALILAFAYTSTQDDRHGKTTIFILTIPTPWVPYFMLLMTLVQAGMGATKIQATGLIAAHLHDFLTRLWPTFGGRRNWVTTPAFVKRMWQTTRPEVANRAYGTSFTPAQRSTGTTSGAATGEGVLPESWKSRGSGHRLGGE